MKKLIPFLFAVLLFASCQKDPDLDKLDNDFVVFTNYDKNTNFGVFSTYYVPDSVLLISSSAKAEYWTDANADQIINTFVAQMNARGYQRVDDKLDADLGLQISYVESTNYFYDYTGSPYWWWGYPGYWYPGYWGTGWGDWYYPYPVIYSYSVGSLLTEMVDLTKEPTPGSKEKLPVVWTAYMSGLLSGNSQFNMQLSIRAIEQAFAQSSYIKTSAK